MSNPHYVNTHGKRILVEDLDIDPLSKPAPACKRSKRGNFTAIPLAWAAEMMKALGTPGAFVIILLHYMAWKNRSQTFPLSNTLLKKYGIDRRSKYVVLEKLEATGQIRIERRGPKSAPIITLLTPS